jgi:alcohol dehydrogenase
MKILYFKLRAVVVTWLMRLLPRNPPIVYKGINSALTLCEQVAVLVTDHFLDSSGLLDGIKATLQKTGVEFLVYDGVLPDPAFDQVQAGEAMLRSGHCTAIIAVGGGSVLDAAKMMAMLHTNPGDLQSFDGIQKCKRPGHTPQGAYRRQQDDPGLCRP